MKTKNLKRLKAELFTYGIRFNKTDLEKLKNQNPFNEGRSGLSAGRFVILEKDYFINIPFWEPFIEYSPFEYKNKKLYKDSKQLEVKLKFASTPKWINRKLKSGNFAGKVIQAHGKNNLATMIFGCEFQSCERRCKFCTAPSYNGRVLRTVDEICEAVSYALMENPRYSISINAGTLLTEGRGLELTTQYIKSLRKLFPSLGIMIEVAPPKNKNWLKKLYQTNMDGPLGIMLNLNFWSDAALNIVEPGKNKEITKNDYLKAWEEVKRLFGENSVSSCILVGVEAENYTRTAIDKLTNLGVIPELIMYRPTIGSTLGKVPLDPDLFLRLSNYAKTQMVKKGITPMQVGCINCGGCSLTVN